MACTGLTQENIDELISNVTKVNEWATGGATSSTTFGATQVPSPAKAIADLELEAHSVKALISFASAANVTGQGESHTPLPSSPAGFADYNDNTGVFTVPSMGYYEICVRLHMDGFASAPAKGLLEILHVGNTNSFLSCFNSNVDYTWVTLETTIFIFLSAGQTVSVRCKGLGNGATTVDFVTGTLMVKKIKI